MKSSQYKVLTAILFFLLGLNGSAQVYPVQMTPVYNLPYSSRISDYANSFDEKLRLIVNPTDVTINNRAVRLKLYIQGNNINAGSNDFLQGVNPIYINGGELQTLTNLDFGALFRLENLQGITASQYAEPLPDGLYTVCFEMYDFVTGQKLSARSCTTLYLQLNDPPLLNIPTRNEQIAATDFPNILFSWTPRQLNATNVSYKFELKEIQDPNIDPQFGFQMSPLLYEETLFSTALLYDLSKPALIPGKRYAWRVRAISTSGIGENNVFKNNGYSEIFWFRYASNCPVPTFLLSEAQSPTRVRLNWQGNPENTKYHVQYKKRNIAEAEWFSTYTLNTQIIITDLEAGQEYEFRVGAACDPPNTDNLSYIYSGINYFTMPDEDASNPGYNCGINPTINITNQDPLTNLIVNETFTAGDFSVKVLEVSGSGSYTGRGYIVVPYLADTKLAVEFSGITINTDYQLIDGVVQTTYNPDWSSISDLEDLNNNGTIETHDVPFVIDNIIINPGGDIVISGPNGEQITIPGGTNTQITDSSGNVYTVDENGNISGPEQMGPGGPPTPANTDGVASSGESTSITAAGISIRFTKAPQNVYGFDSVENSEHAKIKRLYKKLGNDYYLPYKSILNKNEGGIDDQIVATVTVTDPSIELDSIVFKTQKGIKINSVRNGNAFTLALKGTYSNTEEEVLAVIKQGEKYKVAGAFKLVYLAKRETAKIVLVDAGGSMPDAAVLQAYLNDIYDDAGASFEVVQSLTINIDPYLEDTSKIKSGESGFAAQYTDEQQAINAAIKNTPEYAQHNTAYYLVITNKAPTTAGEIGLMPLGRQVGYIFSGGNHTIGHELGHGIFQMKHPFSENAYQTPSGATNWLMDYSGGTKLPYVHWKQIQSPQWRIGVFDADSEGEFNNLVITPDFRIVSIPQSHMLVSNVVDLPNLPVGTCTGFATFEYNQTTNTYTNIEYYYWKTASARYETNSGRFFRPETVTVTSTANPLISLFYNYTGCPGGMLNLRYNEIETGYQSASGLLSIINSYSNDSTRSTPINCIDFNGTGQAPQARWQKAIVPLDCTVANIQNTIASSLAIINSQIASTTTAESANIILRDNYSTCVFESIPLAKRIEILNIFLQDDGSGGAAVDDEWWEFSYGILSTGDRFFLDNLILSTPVRDRTALLRQGFMANNHRWLRILWNESKNAVLNNDVTLNELVTLISEISNWAGQDFSNLGVPISMKSILVEDLGHYNFSLYGVPKSLAPILIGVAQDNTQFRLDYDYNANPNFAMTIENSSASNSNSVEFTNEGFIHFSQRRKITDNTTYISMPGNSPPHYKYDTFDEEFNPFEPVRLVAKRDFYFLHLGTGNVETEIVVPAILGALYLKLVLNNQTEYTLRQFGNGAAMTAAIVAAPFSGGGSLAAFSASVAVAGGGIAAVDANVTSYMHSLEGNPDVYNQYAEPYANWTLFYNTYQLLEGGLGATEFALALRKVAMVKSWNRFSSGVRNLGPEASNAITEAWKLVKGGSLTNVYYKDVDAFAATFDAPGRVSQAVRNEAFDLYKQGKWGELEILFRSNNLNGGWPPAYGGYNIFDNDLKVGMRFDRYGNAVRTYDGSGIPTLGGNFTSPMPNGNRYSFGQRALNMSEESYDFYYEIEIIRDLPFKGQTGDVIPWHNQVGGGKQTRWEIPDDPATGFPITWNKLAEEGYIKITIKESPSGRYNNLIGTVIDGGVSGIGNWVIQRASFWDDWIDKCFPGKNWNNTIFQTLGIDYNTFKSANTTLDNEMRLMYNTPSAADSFLPGVINSGITIPVKVTANQGERFYKIVPKGNNINTPSPYYLSEAEYQWIKANPSQLEQKLGLPLSSVSAEYDVYTITSQINNNTLFQSAIAPTKQFSNATENIVYNTTGGRTQSVIINNGDTNFWMKSTSPVETINPNTLPQIGN